MCLFRCSCYSPISLSLALSVCRLNCVCASSRILGSISQRGEKVTADDQVQSHTFGLNSKALLSATLTSSFSLWTVLSNWIPSWCFSHSRGLRWPVRPPLTRPLTLCPSFVCNNSMIPTEIKWDIADMDTCSPSVPSFLLSFTLGLFLNNNVSVVSL